MYLIHFLVNVLQSVNWFQPLEQDVISLLLLEGGEAPPVNKDDSAARNELSVHLFWQQLWRCESLWCKTKDQRISGIKLKILGADIVTAPKSSKELLSLSLLQVPDLHPAQTNAPCPRTGRCRTPTPRLRCLFHLPVHLSLSMWCSR